MSEQLQPSKNFPDPNAALLTLRVTELEKIVEELKGAIQLPDAHPHVYPANGSASRYWQELCVSGGTLSLSGAIGTDVVGCNETSSGSQLVHLADGQGVVVETEDVAAMRPVWIPNPATAVYLTGSGPYDVYADAARTVQLASGLTPETASGLLQWNGTNGRLVSAPISGKSYKSILWSNTNSSLFWMRADSGTVTLQTGGTAAISSSAIVWGSNVVVSLTFKSATTPAGTLYVTSIGSGTASISSTSASDAGLSVFWIAFNSVA